MIRRYPNRILIALMVFAGGFALLHGCARDDLLAPDPTTVHTDPGLVLESLRAAYEAMDVEAYERLLHRDFRYMFADAAKTPYDREDDLASTGRMFSGEDRKNSAGRIAPAVASIAFDRLEILEDWAPAAPGEVDWSDAQDVVRAEIAYAFVLHLAAGTHMNVRGRQVVYAVPVRTEDWDGSLYWRWQLLGQRDR